MGSGVDHAHHLEEGGVSSWRVGSVGRSGGVSVGVRLGIQTQAITETVSRVSERISAMNLFILDLLLGCYRGSILAQQPFRA